MENERFPGFIRGLSTRVVAQVLTKCKFCEKSAFGAQFPNAELVDGRGTFVRVRLGCGFCWVC